MDLLPWLIPGTLLSQVSVALALVRYESATWYGYFWHILELTVPGFNPVVPIQVPTWIGMDNIFGFALDYLLYFCLQENMNFHYNDCIRSGIFLQSIQFSEYADTVIVLQIQLNLFHFEYNEGYLPPHLCIHGLATSIH